MKKNETVLIVGGAGYIGSHINKELYKKGYSTLVLDSLVYGHREFARWGEFIQGDIADRELLDSLFQEYPITAVMHFSAFAFVGESVTDPEKYYINNVANTINLLQAMRAHQIKNFIFSSTCAVYGDPIDVPIPEGHPNNPINPYGRTKLMVEHILQDYARAYDLRYAALRYFNAAGADPDTDVGEWHNPETHLIPLVLDAAAGIREDIKVFGTDYPTPDGTCIRDYIHVTDLAQAHIQALEYLNAGNPSDYFNLGNGTGFSVRQVIDTAEKITGKKISRTNVERRAGDPPALIGSCGKARAVLGWKPHYADLSTIIDTAWKWHQKLNKK